VEVDDVTELGALIALWEMVRNPRRSDRRAEAAFQRFGGGRNFHDIFITWEAGLLAMFEGVEQHQVRAGSLRSILRYVEVAQELQDARSVSEEDSRM
jgi:hypothetical protein